MVGDVVPQAPGVVHGLAIVTDAVVEHAGWLAGAIGAALIVWAASAAWWRRRAVRELGRRARFELVPAVTFEPQLGDIGQAAARLDEARAAAGGVPRRAAAVRVRAWAGPESQLHYGWEGPERAASVLRMPGYRHVEVRPADAAQGASTRIRFEGVEPKAGGW
ncbi:hypothetical protein ABT187_38715 [Streptomyces sp. NPDC001817]|uniref:hypothetical protein n=1 Tax=Streptomyces sp. NPDC001817 TaxID=3154398 RepID=UPI003320FB7F